MNLHDGYLFQAAYPLSYVIFCCFLSISSLSSNPILCRKKIFCSRKQWGGWSPLPTNSKLYCILILHNVVTYLVTFIIRVQTTNVFVFPQLVPMQKKQKWHHQIAFFIFCKRNAFNFKSKKYHQKYSLAKIVEVLTQDKLRIYRV